MLGVCLAMPPVRFEPAIDQEITHGQADTFEHLVGRKALPRAAPTSIERDVRWIRERTQSRFAASQVNWLGTSGQPSSHIAAEVAVISCPCREKDETPSSSTSWNACSSRARFKRSDRARRFRSALACEGTASTSPSSAGMRPASAWTCSSAPRMPHRAAASSSTRRGTRPATSGTSGSKGFGPGSSTAFASPDPMRPMTGIGSTRTSSCWIRMPPRSFRRRMAILNPPLATIPRRLGRTCRSPMSTTPAPLPSASSRMRTSTGTAINPSACRGPRPSSTSCTCAGARSIRAPARRFPGRTARSLERFRT